MVDDTEHPTNVLLSQASENRKVLAHIADKWSILILTVLCVEPTRFNAIKRRLTGVTHKSLTESLRRLERSGLITRRVISGPVLGVEYSITPLGRTLQEPCVAIARWVAEHSHTVLEAQENYDKQRAAESET